jgi:hypothetical protein
MTLPAILEKPLRIARLDQETYLLLEKKFSRPVVAQDTTQLQAAYQLGVQAVLQELRNGFTIGS